MAGRKTEMTSQTLALIAPAILAFQLSQMLDPAAAVAAGEAVQCYNEAQGTVHETLESDCDGTIVGEGRAREIRQKRRDYIKQAISTPNTPDMGGKQLTGTGSGFFVAEDGSVITSHHVIDDCTAISVSPTFGPMAIATRVAVDEQTDLALLRAEVTPPAVASIVSSDSMNILGPAYVIGYPNRGLVTIEPVLSAVDMLRQASHTARGPAIIVKGDVRRGNSGGPLLDSGGSVLGVVFAKVNSVNVYQTTGQVVEDIGLVLPGNLLESFLDSHGVNYHRGRGRPPQPAERILIDARPFLAQIGCWK